MKTNPKSEIRNLEEARNGEVSLSPTRRLAVSFFAAAALLSTLNPQPPPSLAAPFPGFTYQGRLNDSAALASGVYDLRFAIFSMASGGLPISSVLTNAATPVSNGLFTVTLNFGHGLFDGDQRWLEVAVRTNGAGEFSVLSPRQEITSAPKALYAIQAESAFGVPSGGGYRLFTSTNATSGVYLAANATSWSTISDRNAKKNFAAVNAEEVLNKLASVPILQWNYNWEPDDATPNLGPVAQDFKAAFYPNRDDKTITTLEYDGVELAAIQGLNQKVEKQRAELEQKQTEITELKRRLEKLETLLQQRNGGGQ